MGRHHRYSGENSGSEDEEQERRGRSRHRRDRRNFRPRRSHRQRQRYEEQSYSRSPSPKRQRHPSPGIYWSYSRNQYSFSGDGRVRYVTVFWSLLRSESEGILVVCPNSLFTDGVPRPGQKVCFRAIWDPDHTDDADWRATEVGIAVDKKRRRSPSPLLRGLSGERPTRPGDLYSEDPNVRLENGFRALWQMRGAQYQYKRRHMM